VTWNISSFGYTTFTAPGTRLPDEPFFFTDKELSGPLLNPSFQVGHPF